MIVLRLDDQTVESVNRVLDSFFRLDRYDQVTLGIVGIVNWRLGKRAAAIPI